MLNDLMHLNSSSVDLALLINCRILHNVSIRRAFTRMRVLVALLTFAVPPLELTRVAGGELWQAFTSVWKQVVSSNWFVDWWLCWLVFWLIWTLTVSFCPRVGRQGDERSVIMCAFASAFARAVVNDGQVVLSWVFVVKVLSWYAGKGSPKPYHCKEAVSLATLMSDRKTLLSLGRRWWELDPDKVLWDGIGSLMVLFEVIGERLPWLITGLETDVDVDVANVTSGVDSLSRLLLKDSKQPCCFPVAAIALPIDVESPTLDWSSLTIPSRHLLRLSLQKGMRQFKSTHDSECLEARYLTSWQMAQLSFLHPRECCNFSLVFTQSGRMQLGFEQYNACWRNCWRLLNTHPASSFWSAIPGPWTRSEELKCMCISRT